MVRVAQGALEVRVVVVLLHGHPREQARARETAEDEGEVEAVAQLPLAEVGHQEHEAHRRTGQDDGPDDFGFAGEVFQQLEEEEEIPLGPRGGELRGRIRRRSQLRAARDEGEHHHGEEHAEARDGVGEHLVRPELGVGFLQRLLGVEAVAAEEVNVPADERDDETRQHARVQREEARERVVPVVRPAHDELLQVRPDEGHDADDVGGDLRGPVALLVPRQQVAGERERERELQEQEAGPEVELARGFVGAVNEHLEQMQRKEDGHYLRGVMVQPAQEPATRHLELDVEDAFPRRLRAGAVGHPQEDAGDDLDGEREGERAAPDVTPARAAGDVFVERLLRELAVAGAGINPVEQRFHPGGNHGQWGASVKVGRLNRVPLTTPRPCGPCRSRNSGTAPRPRRWRALRSSSCPGHGPKDCHRCACPPA